MTQQEQDQARYAFWCFNIAGYSDMNRSQRRNAKAQFCDEDFQPHQYGPKSTGMMNYQGSTMSTNPYDINYYCIDDVKLSSCPTITSVPTYIGTIRSEKEPTKENNMYAHINTQDDPNAMQRNYLTNRLDNLWWELVRKLEKQFYLAWDEPKTPEEAIQLIKDGKYTIEPNEDNFRDHNWRDRFSWRTEKEDYAGFDKAVETLTKKFQLVRDAIKINDPKDALKMLQALES